MSEDEVSVTACEQSRMSLKLQAKRSRGVSHFEILEARTARSCNCTGEIHGAAQAPPPYPVYRYCIYTLWQLRGKIRASCGKKRAHRALVCASALQASACRKRAAPRRQGGGTRGLTTVECGRISRQSDGSPDEEKLNAYRMSARQATPFERSVAG